VASEDGVLALLRRTTGLPLWRDVLPAGDTVDRLVAAPGRALGLCNGGTLLRAWSLETGALQWETSLVKVSDAPLSLRSQALDLTVDAGPGLVAALQDNCVNYVDLASGEVSWFWCPSDDLVVVSHLVPSPPARGKAAAATASGEYRRAAVACRVSGAGTGAAEGPGDAASMPCLSAIVLTAFVPARSAAAAEGKRHSMELDEMGVGNLGGEEAEAGAALSPAALRSAFQQVSFDTSAAAKTFGPRDVLFAARVGGAGGSAILVLPLGGGQGQELSVQTLTRDMPADAVTAETGTLGADGTGVVTFCSASGGCEVFSVSAGGAEGGAASAARVVSCGSEDGAAEGYAGAGGGAVAAAQRGPASAWGHLRAVGCAAVQAPSQADAPLRVVTRAVRPESGSGLGGVVTATVAVPRGPHGHSLLRTLRAAYIEVFSAPPTPAGSGSVLAARSLLVGGGVGSAFLAQGGEVLWSREEALAHIKQALMIPRPQADAGGSGSGGSEAASASASASLALLPRLRMQAAELARFWAHAGRTLSLQGRLAVLHLLDADSRRASLSALARSLGVPLPAPAPAPASVGRERAGEDSYLRTLERAAEREARDSTGLQFGFDKYAIVLSHATATAAAAATGLDAGGVALSADRFLSNALRREGVNGGVKVLALDLIHGEVAWGAEPDLAPFARHVAARRRAAGAGAGAGDTVSVYLKLLPGATRRDESFAGLEADPLGQGIGAALFLASVRYSPEGGEAGAGAAEDVLTCVWHLDVHSGRTHHSTPAGGGAPTACLPTGPGAVAGVTLVDRLAAAQLLHTPEEAAELAAASTVLGGAYTHLLLRHDDLTVSAYPPAKAKAGAGAGAAASSQGQGQGQGSAEHHTPQYVHAFSGDGGSGGGGGLVTYRLQREREVVHAGGCPASAAFPPAAAPACPPHGTHPLAAVGSALTHAGGAGGGRVLAVAYPTPHDKATSRAYVLGDKSLLLKYLSPNIAVVVTESFEAMEAGAGAGAGETAAAVGEQGAMDASPAPASPAPAPPVAQSVSHLVVTVLDTVTARVIYRYEIAHGGPPPSASDGNGNGSGGSGPAVHAEMVEHAVVVTYWNYRAQRTELSSLVLFEGMIPRTGLGPVTSWQAPPSVDVSSFSAPQPIGKRQTDRQIDR
jgi:hypothetical protein